MLGDVVFTSALLPLETRVGYPVPTSHLCTGTLGLDDDDLNDRGVAANAGGP